MKKPVKVALAATLGATLLMSGSTYALWTSSVNPGTAASIITGDSSITALNSGSWTDLVQNQPIADINSFRAAPKDELGYRQLFNVKFTGDPTTKNLMQLKFLDDSKVNPAALNARGITVQSTVKNVDTGESSSSDLSTISLTTGYTFTGSLPTSGSRVEVSLSFKISSDVSAEDTKKLQTLVSSSTLSVEQVTTPVAEKPAPIELATNGSDSYQLQAEGNPDPTWSIVSGELPTGLNLSEDGLISGTPKASMRRMAVARATNPAGSTDVPLDITVTEPIVFSTDANLPNFSVGVPYSKRIEASGNPVFKLASGSLPYGVTLSSDGLISGTPTTNSISQTSFTISATNDKGSVSKSFTMSLEVPKFGQPSAIAGYEYQAQTIPLNITGLGPDSDITVTSTGVPLPSNLRIIGTSLVADGNMRAGSYSFTLRATNKTGGSFNQGFTYNVKASSNIQWVNNSTITAPAVVNSPRYYNIAFYQNPSSTITVRSGALPDGVTIASNGRVTGYMTKSGVYTAVLQSGAQTMTLKFVG